MPGADEILEGLAAIANTWQSLAVFWHACFAVLAAAILSGWRPSRRVAGALLTLPLASVSVLAWAAGNPFNGLAFALLTGILVLAVPGLQARPVRIAHWTWLTAGLALFAFAWSYPHFLEGEPAHAYLYAAPLGLIPCPTLSMIVGSTLAFAGLGSRIWTLPVVIAGLFYGLFGSLYLGVGIDWVLFLGASCLLARVVGKRFIRSRRG